MWVLAVTTWFPTPSHPSTGAFVVKDAQAIASLGHDVAIVHLMPPHQAPHDPVGQIGGLPVVTVPMSTSRPDEIASAGRRLRSLASGADLVHTMAFSALLPTIGWRPSVPWVHTEHWSGLTAPHTLPAPWRLILPMLTPQLRAPDVVTAVCDYLAAPIRRERGPRPTEVVPCIVPVPDVAPRPPADGRLRLICVGGLIERKDPLMAVDTVVELRRRGVDAELTFVGEGPLRADLEDHVRAVGLTEQVRLTGSLDRAGVLGELARADLFLGPTRGDNFFVSCAEALVGGRPVVVGATGGQGEYIQDRVGRTVAVQRPDAYADAVEAVLRSTEGMSAEQISATVGQRFSFDAVAHGYAGAYARAQEVAADRAGGRRRPGAR